MIAVVEQVKNFVVENGEKNQAVIIGFDFVEDKYILQSEERTFNLSEKDLMLDYDLNEKDIYRIAESFDY